MTEARIHGPTGPGDQALALVAESFRAKLDPGFVFMFPPFLLLLHF